MGCSNSKAKEAAESPKAQAEKPKAQAEKPKAQAEKPKAQAEKPKAQAEKPKAQAEKPKAAADKPNDAAAAVAAKPAQQPAQQAEQPSAAAPPANKPAAMYTADGKLIIPPTAEEKIAFDAETTKQAAIIDALMHSASDHPSAARAELPADVAKESQPSAAPPLDVREVRQPEATHTATAAESDVPISVHKRPPGQSRSRSTSVEAPSHAVPVVQEIRRTSVSGTQDEHVVTEVTYLGPGPAPDFPAEVAYRCFEEQNGLLFRLVNNTHHRWAFYNDTEVYIMHIHVTFGNESAVKALGQTKLTMLNEETGHCSLELTVGPGKTELFMSGEYNGFVTYYNAEPIPYEQRKK